MQKLVLIKSIAAKSALIGLIPSLSAFAESIAVE
jgi:hypothetical protein